MVMSSPGATATFWAVAEFTTPPAVTTSPFVLTVNVAGCVVTPPLVTVRRKVPALARNPLPTTTRNVEASTNTLPTVCPFTCAEAPDEKPPPATVIVVSPDPAGIVAGVSDKITGTLPIFKVTGITIGLFAAPGTLIVILPE